MTIDEIINKTNGYYIICIPNQEIQREFRSFEYSRKSGNGRSNIILKSKRKELSSYILEFKYTKDDYTNLKDLANQAIEQIINNYYDIGINGKIIYIGLVHQKKNVKLYRRKQIVQTKHSKYKCCVFYYVNNKVFLFLYDKRQS